MRGPAGGTGESCAEIFAIVKFYNEKGVLIQTVTTTTHVVCCPED